MRGQNMLKERIVKIVEEEELVREMEIPQVHLNEYEYIYVVQDKYEKYPIKWILGDVEYLESWKGIVRDFSEYSEWEAPETICDCMFFLDVYDRSRFYSFPLNEIYSREFTSDPVVDLMLRDSHGFLLWKYQLEILLGFFCSDNTRPRVLSQTLNGASLSDGTFFPDKQELLEQTKKMKFTDNLSLYDILAQRTVVNCHNEIRIRIPGWKDAHNLYKTLIEATG